MAANDIEDVPEGVISKFEFERYRSQAPPVKFQIDGLVANAQRETAKRAWTVILIPPLFVPVRFPSPQTTFNVSRNLFGFVAVYIICILSNSGE
jgi:hypothetical protein